MSGVDERVAEAEEIVRALGRLVQAMYDSDLAAGWPTDSDPLIDAYQERYGVDLSV